MWINKNEYQRLITISKLYQALKYDMAINKVWMAKFSDLEKENEKLKKENRQLKRKYSDEIEKNFKLARLLSKMNKR